MSKKKPLPEILDCFCGRPGWTIEDPMSRPPQRPSVMRWHAACQNTMCWVGPIRKTQRGAINAWNRRKP